MPLPSEDDVRRELGTVRGPEQVPASSDVRITLPVHGRADVVAGLEQAKAFRTQLQATEHSDTLSAVERDYMHAYAIEAFANAAVWNREHPGEQVAL